MAKQHFVIFVGEENWRIGCASARGVEIDDLPTDKDLRQLLSAVTATLRGKGYRREGVILVPPPEWCFCSGVSTVSLPRKHAHSALLYRFEEKLPIAMEELVADLALPKAKSTSARVLGVAVQLAKLQEIVEGLEAEGIAIEIICPAPLLALIRVHDEARKWDMLIWDYEKSRNVLTLANGQVQDWRLLSLEFEELKLDLAVKAVQSRERLSLAVYSDDDDLKLRLAEVADVQLCSCEARDLLATATAASINLLRGKQSPPINLRREALGVVDAQRHIRVPLTAALVSCILFLSVLIGVLLYRARGYERLTQRLEADQRQVFFHLWPGKAAPTSIKSRLASEEARLRGLSGDAKGPSTTPSALVLMHETLKRLPSGMRFRVLEVRCGAEGIYLEGEARSHGEADAIASALRNQQSFKIEGPRTEQLSGQGVSFTINASYTPLPQAESVALESHAKK